MEQGNKNTPYRSGKSNKLVARDISESIGKLPPQSIELEEAVLGAMMLEKSAVVTVAGFMKPEHFYLESHREIFAAILRLYSNADPVDMRTVVNQLRKDGKIELVGGGVYIAELTNKFSSAANIEYHGRKVIEFAILRDIITLASEMHQQAYEDTTDAFELVEKLTLGARKLMEGNLTGQKEKHIKELSVAAMKLYAMRKDGHASGVLSGYKAVDRLLNGFNFSDLIIVAARPGMGKTAFMVGAAKNASMSGIPVAIFSLEMSGVQLVERLAIGEAEIDQDKLKKATLTEHELNKYIEAHGRLSSAPMYIDDTPMLSTIELRARCMRMVVEYGVKMIIVDYLQLMRAVSDGGVKINRDQEIGIITRTLKAIAKELNVPVLAGSQLSRGVETRGGTKRPQLSDLRESGNIEQDADVVAFLYRPEYYKITVDEDGLPTHGMCEVIIAKHRNGATGTERVKFIGRLTKFMDWEMEQQPSILQIEGKKIFSQLPRERDFTEEEFNDDKPF